MIRAAAPAGDGHLTYDEFVRVRMHASLITAADDDEQGRYFLGNGSHVSEQKSPS